MQGLLAVSFWPTLPQAILNAKCLHFLWYPIRMGIQQPVPPVLRPLTRKESNSAAKSRGVYHGGRFLHIIEPFKS